MRMGGTAERVVLIPLLSSKSRAVLSPPRMLQPHVPSAEMPPSTYVSPSDMSMGGTPAGDEAESLVVDMEEGGGVRDGARDGGGGDIACALDPDGDDDNSERARRRAAQLAAVIARFESFDVAEAKATKEEDRQHLLGVIELGFGELAVFNSLVRHLFASKDLALFTEQGNETNGMMAEEDRRLKTSYMKPRRGTSSLRTRGTAARVLPNERG